MTIEVLNVDFGSNSYAVCEGNNPVAIQQEKIAEIFRDVAHNLNKTIIPVMARCTRDFEIDIYYQDKDGNRYGIDIEIRGGKEAEESQEIASDDRPDPDYRE